MVMALSKKKTACASRMRTCYGRKTSATTTASLPSARTRTSPRTSTSSARPTSSRQPRPPRRPWQGLSCPRPATRPRLLGLSIRTATHHPTARSASSHGAPPDEIKSKFGQCKDTGATEDRRPAPWSATRASMTAAPRQQPRPSPRPHRLPCGSTRRGSTSGARKK